jgi:hypothetical protein
LTRINIASKFVSLRVRLFSFKGSLKTIVDNKRRNIMALSVKTMSFTKLSITTRSIMTFRVKTISLKTLSITVTNVKLNIMTNAYDVLLCGVNLC